jgi:uncharacterized phage protein gp47/JayE
MALLLSEVLRVRGRDEWRALLYGFLQGRGFVYSDGLGLGTLALSGTPTGSYDVVLKVTGAPTTLSVQFAYSLDGGGSFGATVQADSSGLYALPIGVSVRFVPAPAGTSWVAGDSLRFSTATPTLPVTSWQEGSFGRTLVDTDAVVLEDESLYQRRLVDGGFLETAEGAWLTLLARNLYGLDRRQGAVAQGDVLLSDVLSAGPFSLAAGQLTLESTSGLRFRNTAAATVPKGATGFALRVQAEKPGAAYNVGLGALTKLVTALPGVTATNGAAWLAAQGREEESDELLRARCRARWGSLGPAAPSGAYETWARAALADVTQVRARASATVPGQVDVLVAGAGGALSAAQVATVNSYVQARVPLANTAVVASAANRTLTVGGTVYVAAANRDAAVAQNQLELDALIHSIPIGGTIYRSALIDKVMNPVGVRNVDLTLPAADTALGAAEVAVLANSLTYTSL